MAKQNGLFQHNGTFQGVTAVHSRAYGDHIRKARTVFTLSEGMMESSDVMKQANVYAKVFKDAIDPYRRDFRYGMLWQRLVSLFKKQLQKKENADFIVLEGQDLNKKHPLSLILSVNAIVAQTENYLDIHVTSRHTKNPTKERADGYQQTLIVLFIGDDLQTQSFSESAFISLHADPGEQAMRCAIPSSMTTAILVLKCNFSLKNKPMDLQKAMGMKVVKVMAIE